MDQKVNHGDASSSEHDSSATEDPFGYLSSMSDKESETEDATYFKNPGKVAGQKLKHFWDNHVNHDFDDKVSRGIRARRPNNSRLHRKKSGRGEKRVAANEHVASTSTAELGKGGFKPHRKVSR